MEIAVVGTGYVGLVSGACFAEMGNRVTCVDIDEQKVANLNNGILPIYEPGLEDVVVRNHAEGRLKFTTSLPEAMQTCDIFFIAVGTPPGEDGSADLQYVLAVAREIGQHLNRHALIVDKSTVPVGTADKVRHAVQQALDARGVALDFDVVSNPEFLKEGDAVNDFMRPDRIVVGVDNDHARQLMEALYAPFNRNHQRTLFMGVRDAEMTKYAANAMLATKISFMNEVAGLCEQMAVDVENVRLGIGSDSRIGYSFIYPGCGYGGSCFPKDVQALVRMADSSDFEPHLLNAVETRNNQQKLRMAKKVVDYFGPDLSGRHFAIWGLAFKPGTDDMREAPSVYLLKDLLAAGATACAYDPVAMPTAQRELPATWFANGQLTLADDQYAALNDADALILLTEWKPFRHPDLEVLTRRLKTPAVFDGRNQYDPEQMRAAGFFYSGIGR